MERSQPHPGADERQTSKRLIVLSAPSGAGKTTIARRLLERHPDWRFSISATTRERRPAEEHGRDYFFLTTEEFRQKIDENDLVEWEEIFGNYYGTLRSEVAKVLEDGGGRMIFDVDVKGALAIRDCFPEHAYLIFIAPPSLEELKRRLLSRKTESDEVIARRIARADMEMGMRQHFDAIVVNDEVERAVEEVERNVEGGVGEDEG